MSEASIPPFNPGQPAKGALPANLLAPSVSVRDQVIATITKSLGISPTYVDENNQLKKDLALDSLDLFRNSIK